MSPHAVNNFVSDLVLMAQAMERLPQVEAELQNAQDMIQGNLNRIASIEADLEQSQSYAASLEQKVRDAEVAKDAAETMFLEADERAEKAIHLLAGVIEEARLVESEVSRSIAFLSPPKPEPQSEPKVESDDPLPDTTLGTTMNTALVDGPNQSVSHTEPTASTVAEGQSEPGPTANGPIASQTDGPSAEIAPVSGATHTDTVIETPQDKGPYWGLSYHSLPYYVSPDAWIRGGGTEHDYWNKRESGS